MKKYLAVIILLLGLISCGRSVDAGLAAYYPFDGDARDYSGDDNHGNIDGLVLTSFHTLENFKTSICRLCGRQRC